jgi:hypothetical protein
MSCISAGVRISLAVDGSRGTVPSAGAPRARGTAAVADTGRALLPAHRRRRARRSDGDFTAGAGEYASVIGAQGQRARADPPDGRSSSGSTLTTGSSWPKPGPRAPVLVAGQETSKRFGARVDGKFSDRRALFL